MTIDSNHQENDQELFFTRIQEPEETEDLHIYQYCRSDSGDNVLPDDLSFRSERIQF
jgi:hypothetical protein